MRLLLFSLLLAAPLARAQAVAVDRIVASVDTRAITRSMVDERVKQGITNRVEARDALIEEALIALDAERLGLSITDAEVDRALHEIAQSNNLTEAQLYDALKQQGYELASYREALRTQLRSMRWVLNRAGDSLPREPLERAAGLDAARKRLLEKLRATTSVELRGGQP